MQINKIHEFTGIPKIYKQIAPLRGRVKTAVIQMHFNGPGAHFLPRTSQNQFFGVSCAILPKCNKFNYISLNSRHVIEIQGFSPPAASQERKHQ